MTHEINWEKKLLAEGKCCVTGKPLKGCNEIHEVFLEMDAAWSFPTWGDSTNGKFKMAMAYVHDDCIRPDGSICGDVLFAVELKDNEIIYHPVKQLI